MRKIISKSRAEGEISIPGSKSAAHRLLIMAAMCENKTSVIHGIPSSEDLLATMDCLRSMGVKIEYDGECAKIYGIDFSKSEPQGELNCRESGSTLRFLIPLATLSGKEVCFVGSERLFERPLNVYHELGFKIKRTSDASITVCGRLTAGEYRVSGNVSSQFITGMILALSSLPTESKIRIQGKIESRPYIDLTLDILNSARWEDESTISIPGGGFTSGEYTIEGDWSGAANFEALNHLSGRVILHGLNENSVLGDRICRHYFEMLGRGYCEINIENTPDLGPILFVVAAAKEGGRFYGIERLRIKESDRIAAMEKELSKFGARLIAEQDSLTILKSDLHKPTEPIQGHNDHRIVMAMAVLCTLYGGEIEGWEAVRKSYPSFFDDLESLLN